MSTLKKLLLLWMGLLVLIFVVARFIVTDSKRVHRVLQACEDAIRSADADGLMAHIARGYEYQSLDWPTMHSATTAIFKRSQFATTFLRAKSIKVNGDSADVKFSAFVQSVEGSALPGPFDTRWRLKMEKRENQWVITEIEFISLNGNPVGTLGEMMAQAAAMSGE